MTIELDDDLGEVFRIARTPEGEFLERVAGEEQHHSSWLFGDPITPILRCYKGDPARIRLVHGGVKETHVFHLHVHQWRATPQDGATPGTAAGSQLLDSITIGPQTAYTIDPLYGSGSRQHLPGDVIWHCHLYPHFHHGMWGLWRSFDRFVDGSLAFPDGTPGRRLAPLPGRDPDPVDADHPGFPWFIDAEFPQKAPPPPALLPEHKYGRRALLEMPLHSKLEKAAFAQGVVDRPRPGMLFVDLDGDQVTWNQKAGLPPPRIIHYDVEVASGLVEYNENGWHDDNGHFYRITGIAISQLDGTGEVVTCEPVAAPPFTGPKPFFPRANQGDIVELTFINTLGTLPADDFDLITPPVECGLHVHLVKFDVMAADGSSTGWNYLSGASCREAVGPDLAGDAVSRIVGFHRWVVDEEFGPCFFHDHLLANFRQKHGLFAALIAEPFRSQWLTTDQNGTAWSDAEAVIVPPDADPLPPYREACLAIGDFVPLHDGRGEPLNPPGELGGDDDPGAMAVNYRNAPLRFRGDDPSEWFSSREHRPDELEPPDPDGVPRRFGDPDTGVIRTYPGERLRIRLIQGSHEEQHGFVLHGMRWRREWHDPTSTLVNQQTLGISEAFTLDIDPEEASPYGPGDHLWSFHAMDDLWLGCWGLIRALVPGPTHADLPPLPTPPGPTRPVPSRPTEPDRDYLVVARRREHKYRGHVLTDPWGLEYVLADRPPLTLPDDHLRIDRVHDEPGPLVLRARAGEWVRVTLVNEVLLPELDADDDEIGAGVPAGHEDDPRFFADPLLPEFGVEPSPPRLPIEHVDELGDPDRRTVSPRVSLHAALLSYDVISDDGSNVGRNHDGTVGTLPVDDATRGARRGRQGRAARRPRQPRRAQLARVLVVRRPAARPGRRRRAGVPAAGHGGHPQPPPPRPGRRAGRAPGRPHPAGRARRRAVERAGGADRRRRRRDRGAREGAVPAGRAAAVRRRQPGRAGARRGARRRPGGLGAEGHQLPHRAGAPPHAARRPRAAHPDDGGARRRHGVAAGRLRRRQAAQPHVHRPRRLVAVGAAAGPGTAGGSGRRDHRRQRARPGVRRRGAGRPRLPRRGLPVVGRAGDVGHPARALTARHLSRQRVIGDPIATAVLRFRVR